MDAGQGQGHITPTGDGTDAHGTIITRTMITALLRKNTQMLVGPTDIYVHAGITPVIYRGNVEQATGTDAKLIHEAKTALSYLSTVRKQKGTKKDALHLRLKSES